jgi:hypothetical protein
MKKASLFLSSCFHDTPAETRRAIGLMLILLLALAALMFHTGCASTRAGLNCPLRAAVLRSLSSALRPLLSQFQLLIRPPLSFLSVVL